MATIADDLADGSQAKAAVLLIVGEPFSDSDKTLILEEIVKGFQGWDCESSGVDINDELAQIANSAALGEEGPNGERIIRHRSDNLALEALINPQSQTVKDSLKAILTQPAPVKAVVYAGYAFQGTAAWVVQDDLFTISTFNQIFKDSNVENALKQVDGASLLLHTVSPADWSFGLKGSDVERLLQVSVNPKGKLDHSHGLLQFAAYVNNFIRAVPLSSMLKASDVVGNISFTRPVLYIFPAHQGDAALFGMKGFNMLVDGGYSRRSCFWDFVCHLDGIDALLLTHLGPDNLFGIKAALERKGTEIIHPDIDFIYMNTGKATNGVKSITDGDSNASDSGLVINLATEGNRLLELSRKLGHSPHPVTRHLSGNLEPINLFHKVGKGSLDMYVLNPVGDAKEMKDFLSQWGKQVPNFSHANGIPIPNCISVCALLVVRPASPTEKITRILFSGTAPQHKLLEGLERVKHLEFLKHPTFCSHDAQKPKKPASAATNGRAGSSSRKPVSAAASKSTTSAKPEPPKRLETKPAAPRASASAPASAKAAKLQKESNNKRASSAKDKEKVKLDEKEKEDKSKSSTSSSPSKASVKTASPAKSPSSPAKTPATATPDDIPEIVASPLVQSQPLAPETYEEPSLPQSNHLDQDFIADPSDLMQETPASPQYNQVDDNRMVDSPEALPEPERFDSFTGHQAANADIEERERLRELGIYDDEDEGVDDGFDDKENGGMFGGPPEADDEEIHPQSLPEPVVADLETPSSTEPDLIQDTFTKPSIMEESQIFENEITPDYAAADLSLQAESPTQEPSEDQPAPPAEPEFWKPEEEEEQSWAQPEPPESLKPEDEEDLPEQVESLKPEDEEEQLPEQEDLLKPEHEEEQLLEQAKSLKPEDEEELPEQEGLSVEQGSLKPEEEEQQLASGYDDTDPAEDMLFYSKTQQEDLLNEPSLPHEEQSFSDKEYSPDPQESNYDHEFKEPSPALEEPSFADENEIAENGDAIEQNIQYGVTSDNGFQMGGIREEEEEEEIAGNRESVAEEEELESECQRMSAQAVELKKSTMEELGIYDDDDQDYEADERDTYVYEKDVNLEDEEVRMEVGPLDTEQSAEVGTQGLEVEQDQQSSNIPEAFEKDETPIPMGKPATGDEVPQTYIGQEDRDSIDGGTPDDDKDIDEILAMQQQQQEANLNQEQDDDVEDQIAEDMSGAGSGNNFNPFTGLDAQITATVPDEETLLRGEAGHYEDDDLEHPDQQADSAEFDPLARWGPPTGLPAPTSLQGDMEAEEEDVNFSEQETISEQQEPFVGLEDIGEQDVPDENISGQEYAIHGLGSTAVDSQSKMTFPLDSEDIADSEKSSEADPREFDPLSEWGHPMGLPSPPPPEGESKNTTTKSGAGDAKKADSKKSTTSPMKSKMGTEKRLAAAAKSPVKPANGIAEPPKSTRSKPDPKRASLDTSRSARPASSRSLDTSKLEPKSRTTAASTANARKPASASFKRASPEVIKMPPLPPFTPFYVDLTYIPNHGDLSYVDSDFFKRVRARYYVLSARNPNPKILELLIEAKATWDKANEQEVTVIPTYETQILQHWMAVHKEKLAENKIDIAPSASRCTVRLQDHEDSCYTYRLEF